MDTIEQGNNIIVYLTPKKITGKDIDLNYKLSETGEEFPVTNAGYEEMQAARDAWYDAQIIDFDRYRL